MELDRDNMDQTTPIGNFVNAPGGGNWEQDGLSVKDRNFFQRRLTVELTGDNHPAAEEAATAMVRKGRLQDLIDALTDKTWRAEFAQRSWRPAANDFVAHRHPLMPVNIDQADDVAKAARRIKQAAALPIEFEAKQAYITQLLSTEHQAVVSCLDKVGVWDEHDGRLVGQLDVDFMVQKLELLELECRHLVQERDRQRAKEWWGQPAYAPTMVQVPDWMVEGNDLQMPERLREARGQEEGGGRIGGESDRRSGDGGGECVSQDERPPVQRHHQALQMNKDIQRMSGGLCAAGEAYVKVGGT